MNFRYTILYVENVEKTLAFYARAFGLKRGMLHESGDYGELDTGRTRLAFSSLRLMAQLGKTPASPVAERPTFEIALETKDVTGGFARAIGAGAQPVQEPADMAWGQTTAYIRDINGFLVELCTPVCPAGDQP